FRISRRADSRFRTSSSLTPAAWRTRYKTSRQIDSRVGRIGSASSHVSQAVSTTPGVDFCKIRARLTTTRTVINCRGFVTPPSTCVPAGQLWAGVVGHPVTRNQRPAVERVSLVAGLWFLVGKPETVTLTNFQVGN